MSEDRFKAMMLNFYETYRGSGHEPSISSAS